MTQIDNKTQYDWAVARVEELLPLTDKKSLIELELLSNLVADYSDAHFAVGAPSLAEVIKLRMYELGLSQKGLAVILDVSPSRVSDIVTGRTEPTYRMARDLSRKLSIEPGIVLGVG